MYLVESLIQQCHTYVLMHLEEFPASHLSLLPLSTRKELLYQLPIADVCIRLENTEFTAGLDMEAFWNSTWNHVGVDIMRNSVDSSLCCKDDVKSYVHDRWHGVEYERAMAYGIVSSLAIGHLPDMEFRGVLQPYRHNCEVDAAEQLAWGMPLVSFLYGIRKFCVHGCCSAEFPPRYSHKRNKREEDITMSEVRNCFSHDKGELPVIFPELVVMNGDDDESNLDHVYCFLRNAIYVGINGNPFHERGLEFVKAVLREATSLEVLLLDHWGHEETPETKCFDEFCAYLASCQTFLSNFRLLNILSLIDQSPNGFVVSRKNFNQLITAYFAAPTDHVQKIQITHTKVECRNIAFDCSPRIEQQYLAFKTIELGDCQFISQYKATCTPQAISHWLGQGISELPQLDPSGPSKPDTCFFKVEKRSGGLTRKRKLHSELELDGDDQTAIPCSPKICKL